jgi:hypothetical protein
MSQNQTNEPNVGEEGGLRINADGSETLIPYKGMTAAKAAALVSKEVG